MATCLTEEQLRNLAADALAPEESAILLEHVRQCESCRESVNEWRADLAFAGLVRETVTGDAQSSNGAPASASEGARFTGEPEPIDGYTIHEEIRRGAQGVVYRAVQDSTSTPVAIKFLREGPYATQTSQRRFEREIELAATLHHPNIVGIMHSGVTARGSHYYVMPYVEGLPLHRHIWDHSLSLEETLELFISVCDAVNHAHQRGVIHRDLKPSNVLVDSAGVPKVLDFGLARQLVGVQDSFVSMAGQVMGTLPYMSPEQAHGNQSDIDIRTDVYALGGMLYQVLTGQFPYPVTGTIPEILHHITETLPVPPSRAWGKHRGVTRRSSSGRGQQNLCPIDKDLDTILLKMLSKEQDRRYANLVMLMDDLNLYLQGQPIEARRDAWVHALRKRLAHYKTATVLAAMFVLLTAVLAIPMLQMYRIQLQERRQTLAVQSRLIDAMLTLGDNALERREFDDASCHFWAALAMAEHLAATEPDNLDYRAYRAECYLRLGNVARERGELAEARRHYEHFRTIMEELSEVDPANLDYQSRLALAKGLLAELSGPAGTASNPTAPSDPRGGQ